MTRSLRRWVGAVAFLCTPTAAAQAQAAAPARDTMPAYRSRLLGAFDEMNGEPLGGVRVLDVLNGTWTETTSTGTAVLTFLPDGGGLVRLQKLGYEVQTILVTISPTDTTPLTIIMKRVTNLPTVVTVADSVVYRTPALRGFEERRRRENGVFIGEAEIRKSEGRTLANLLTAKSTGITLGYPPKGAMGSQVFLMRSPRCLNGGPPQLYLDGVPQMAVNSGYAPKQNTRAMGGGASVPAFDLSLYDLSNLAAIEWYPDGAMTPIEFAKTSERCGALLLWTRER